MRRSLSSFLPWSRLSTTNLLALILGLLIISTFSFAAAPDRISGPIASGQLVRLSGGVPHQAKTQYDQGSVDPSLKLGYMTLLTVPSASQQKALDQLLVQQQDPRSPQYHKWLTPEQYADRFGLSPNDIQRITNWLLSQGFLISNVARGRNWIVFSGTAAQAERAFQVEIHNFDVNGEKHFSNTTPPSIPASLSGIVTGVRGLSNFRPKSHAVHSKPNYTFPVNGGDKYFIAPGDIVTMYDLGPLYSAGITGAGQKLAVMGQTDVYLADLQDFRSAFGLPAIPTTGTGACTTNANLVITSCATGGNFSYVVVGTDPGTPDTQGDDLPEADIDLEWSNAVAYDAQIVYVNAPETDGGVWDSWYYAVDHTLAPVITLSYGLCELDEAEDGTSGEFTFSGDETELKKASSEGITFMNSAGDVGAAECDDGDIFPTGGYAVSYPASSPEVTGVGGTAIPFADFSGSLLTKYWNTTNASNGGSAKSYIPETAWNDDEEVGAFCVANPTSTNCLNADITSWQTAQSNLSPNELFIGGGGVSNCMTINETTGVCTGGFATPAWQTHLNVNDLALNGQTAARFSPDVSLLASTFWPGFILCTPVDEIGFSGTASTCASGIPGDLDYGFAWGGTSIASPMFAGIVTLLNEYLQTSGGLGNINQTLYSLAATPSNGAFHAVETDTNGVFCEEGTPDVTGWPTAMQCPSSGANPGFLGFSASSFDTTTGYNLVTGLGSVDAEKLAVAWAGTILSATTTTVVSSQNPANQGVAVTFTATVTTVGTHAPTGTVTFYDSTTSIGTGTLNGSQVATLTISTLTVGAHSITAVYGGDTNNAGSTSAVLTQTIVALPATTTALTSSSNPANYASPVTFTATVTTTGSHAPTGTVTFDDGTTSIGSGTLNGSQVATLTISTLTAGSHSITAVYGGDTNNAGSTSVILTQNITAPTFSFSVEPTTPATVLAGLPTTSTFTLAPTGTGVTTFAANVALTLTGCPANTTCSFSTNPIPAGAGATNETLTFTTVGPNTSGGIKNLRRRADNRSPLLPFALPLAGIVMVGFAGRKMSKYSAIVALCASLVLLGLLVACGSSNTPAVGINVSPSGATVFASEPTGDPAQWPPQTATFTATLTNTTNTAVTWAVTTTNGGSITSGGVYTAPTAAAGVPGSATVTATSAADSTKVASATVTITPTTVPGTYPIAITATEGPTQVNPTPASFNLVVQ